MKRKWDGKRENLHELPYTEIVKSGTSTHLTSPHFHNKQGQTLLKNLLRRNTFLRPGFAGCGHFCAFLLHSMYTVQREQYIILNNNVHNQNYYSK